MTDIQKVVVIGSGVMGSGIAAQIANAGVPVLLLDIPVAEGRNKLATEALERMKKQKPAPLMDPKFAERITVGNTEDDLHKIKDYDWIVEVIIENLAIKQSLYSRIDEISGGDIIVSSNTSTIKLHDLISGRSEGFQKNFLITHFFNPPRYMRLLEFVTSDKTDQSIVQDLQRFVDARLGKTVVYSHDTPAFIANRIGIYAALRAFDEALKSRLSIDEIDIVCSKAFDIPKTGIFALFDLVGIDVLAIIAHEMFDNLPEHDLIHKIDAKAMNAIMQGLVEKGYTGRKGLGGFFRMREENGKKIKEALNLKTLEYEPATKKAKIPSLDLAKKDLNGFLTQGDEAPHFAWALISDTLYYAVSLVPEITDDIIYVDRAIRLGFNWKLGPFELIDKLGATWLAEKFKAEGREIPKLLELVGNSTFYKIIEGKRSYLTTAGDYKPIVRPEGILKLKDLKDSQTPLLENPGARLWDIGDGAVCFEFKTKENTFTPDIFDMIQQSIDLVKSHYKALVIHNETENFSFGMNLEYAVESSKQANYDENLIQFTRKGQNAFKSLKFAPFPVIAAPAGIAVGGGCELVLHCDAVVAHAELYIGLVELGLGIIPGWGGCKEMLLRAEETCAGGSLIGFRHVFETLGSAQVATSAYDAQRLMFLRKTDVIIMNRDRVLFEAKQKALAMVEGYKAPEERRIKLPGKPGLTVLKMGMNSLRSSGKISDYDMVVAEKLAYVLTGGPTDILHKVSEQELFELEIQANVELSQNQPTRDRFLHYVETGKVLRN